MDNYLQPTTENEHIKGQATHLPFELITFGITSGGQWDIVSTQAFFSLKLAMATLLTQDMVSLYNRPTPADGTNGPTTVMSVRIKGNPNYFGAIVATHHAHLDYVLDPGLYFSTRRGIDELECVTGIPFLATVPSSDIDLVPLALPDASGVLSPSAQLLHLSRFSLQWIEAQSALMHEMNHELVIKGIYPPSPGKEGYVQHQYFNNPADALEALLSEDMRNFDRFSPLRNYCHTHAYLTGPDGALAASIFTVPISTGQQAAPEAGIYLLAHPNLGALAERTGVPLAAALQYDPKAQNLQLASLQYISEFLIQPTDGLVHIRTEMALLQQETPRYDSAFSVNCHYQLATVGTDSRVIDAMDQYHYRSPEMALYALLHLDLELWNRHFIDPLFAMQVRGAYVQSGDQKLAKIEVSGEEKRNGTSDLQLQLSHNLHTSMPAIYTAIGNYALSSGGAVTAEGITLTIGTFDPLYGTELHRNVTSALSDILQNSFWIQRQVSTTDGQPKAAEPSPALTGVQSATGTSGYVLLEWSGAHMGQSDEGRQLWTADLEAAHRFIQGLPASFFQPPAHDNNLPCLRSARLFDAVQRTVIVTRSYHAQDTPGMAAGFYNAYNMQHPLGAQLASHHPRSRMAEAVSSADTHIFYQGSAAAAHHTRQLASQQDGQRRRNGR